MHDASHVLRGEEIDSAPNTVECGHANKTSMANPPYLGSGSVIKTPKLTLSLFILPILCFPPQTPNYQHSLEIQ
jgi:hypothetical protein